MKKLVNLVLVSVMAITIAGCSSKSSSGKTLKVFNWGEYADMDVIYAFEDEYDCEVIYETYDSNESMYTKLQGGNTYDVMVPSEYMIQRLIKEDLITTIDWSYITNSDSLDSSILNQDFDPNNDYWVPYFYGNVGILYDTTKVDESDLEDGWEILRNTKYKGDIYMYDSERDSFMVALKALGYSMNTTDETEIEEAYNWLVDQRNTMDPTYATDDVIDAMMNSSKAMAVIYSGDAAAVMAENEDMAFFMPEEGTNYWFDGFVVSKDCEDVELAYEFINYMISDENALYNTLAVGYLTSNVNAAKEAAETDFAGISAYSIRIDENDEVFDYQDQETKELFSEYWTKVKAS
ncbi:MAG: ABC transporter substrate-binding protein [Erysipelotrichaceae bacterium]|nr:ABC transporter substrate-binding protein [Erysipelotrichaceae bacterium]